MSIMIQISATPLTIRSKEMFKNAVFSLLRTQVAIYLHYQDIQDLLMQITEEIKNDLTDKINSLVQAKDLTEQQQLIKFLDYLYIQRKSLFSL